MKQIPFFLPMTLFYKVEKNFQSSQGSREKMVLTTIQRYFFLFLNDDICFDPH